MGTNLGFLDKRFVPSLDIESVRLRRLGLRTSEAKFCVTTLDYNSRFRRNNTFLIACSKSTQTLGSIGYFVDLSHFHVPSYSSVSDFRVNLQSNTSDFARFCFVSSRKSETEPYLGTRKCKRSNQYSEAIRAFFAPSPKVGRRL